MTVLVTGSSGHLGEALMRTLQAQRRETIGIDIQPGVFTQATLPLAQTPDAIGLADLNHNGKADLVFINRGSKSVSIMLNL